MASFNLSSRIYDLEAITFSSLSAKAHITQPEFLAPVTIKDGLGDEVIANLDSPGIVFNKPVICNSSLSAPITVQQKKYVDDSINALTQGAPALLNTITELANAINNDPTYATDIATNLTNLNNNVSHRTQQYYFNSGSSVDAAPYGPTYVKIGTLSNITEYIQHIRVTITVSESVNTDNTAGNVYMFYFKKTGNTVGTFWVTAYGY